MSIYQKSLDAIRGAELSGKNLADLFEQMAEGANAVGSQGGLFILSYLDEDSLPQEGELVPTITLALKPFTRQKP